MPNVGNFGTLISLVVLGVTWMIVQPLKQSIVDLRVVVGELKDEVKVSRRELSDLRERLAKLEGSAASAHKRLDAYEKELRK